MFKLSNTQQSCNEVTMKSVSPVDLQVFRSLIPSTYIEQLEKSILLRNKEKEQEKTACLNPETTENPSIQDKWAEL